MRYKIRNIGGDGLPIEVPLSAAWLAAEVSDLDARPGPAGLTFSGLLERSGHDYLFHGTIRGTMVSWCARCLDPAPVAVDVEMAVTYADRAADDADDADVVALEGNEIDVGPPIRDEILLAMPVSPLCRPECAGLCPVCGGNRNETACGCEERQRVAESKLAGLVKLKL